MSEYCNNFVFMDDGSDSFRSWQGLRGPYFTPYVDENGNLSWTNNGGLPNPASVNIAGKGIMLKGTCATTGDLPADPENGDAWAVGASEPYECYAWLGGSWVDLGLLFPKGDPGEGVPASGTTGQILKKSSNTDYDTEWADPDQADWDQADNTQPDYIKNKPSIPVIDNTLSTAGQAADAKAAGDGIKEAEQIVSYVETGATASRNYTAGEYITWKGVAYYAKTNISSGASFVVDTNLTAVGNQGYTNHLKNTIKYGLGAWVTNISFPYTAPSDGIILATMLMSSSSGGYARITIDGSSYKRLQLSSTNGTGNSGSAPIKKGEVAELIKDNCTVDASFIPIN